MKKVEEYGGCTVTVEWLNDWTLHTTWIGSGNGELVRRANVLVNEELKHQPARYLLCETDGVTGYDATIRIPARTLIRDARQRGVSELIVVAAARTRMLAFALGLLARTQTRVFPTFEAAKAYCDRCQTQNVALR